MNMMKFWEWMNKKYIAWRGDDRKTISDFANYVGVRQQVMSSWMKQNGKAPNAKSLSKIASVLGLEVYDVLGLSRPIHPDTLAESFPHLSIDIRERLAAALSEVDDRSKDMPENDPRIDEILRDALKQNGFKI